MAGKDSDPRYDVGGEIAKGGMGEILDAHDLRLDCAVAMKRIRMDRDVSKDLKLRFINEARILARLQHPNIIPIHDLDKDESGRVFYTMKKVQGKDLKQVLSGIRNADAEDLAKHPLSQLLGIFQKICDAMAYAHSHGVIHRDLKPENIMLGEFGEVWVMDWGLAKVLADGHPEIPKQDNAEPSTPGANPPSDFESDSAQTMDGSVMGTPQFMAPEQAEGRIADQDERTDIFALGGLLYGILTLRAPTSGSSLDEILNNIKSGHIQPPSIYNRSKSLLPGGEEAGAPIELAHCPRGMAPEALSAVTMTAMELEAEDRYQSVEELQSEIRAFQGGFATSVEEAGAWRQLLLYVRRNRTFSIATTLIFSLTFGFLITLIRSEGRTRFALDKLEYSIPLIEADIAFQIAGRDFEKALKGTDELLILKPDFANYWNQKGNLLMAQLDFEAAITAYEEALKRERTDADSQASLELCRALIQSDPTGDLGKAEFEQLTQLMAGQGRIALAEAFRRRVFLSADELAAKARRLDSYRVALLKKGISKAIAYRLKYSENSTIKLEDGSLEILLADTDLESLEAFQGIPLEGITVPSKVASLIPLKGMPLKSLGIDDARITDLSPLRGMKLKWFSAMNCQIPDISPLSNMPLKFAELSKNRQVKDIGPLENMPLTSLSLNSNKSITDFAPLKTLKKLEILAISSTKIADLTILSNLPLTRLGIGACRGLTDLEPLRGMPLKWLNVSDLAVSDLSPLTELPLNYLGAKGMQLRDLVFVKGMRQLSKLNVSNNPISDLTPLKGSPLTFLMINDTEVTDLSPLEGMKIIYLRFEECPIRDLSPLKEMRTLQNLQLRETRVGDLSHLAGMKLTTLSLDKTAVVDLSPLNGEELKELTLGGCVGLRDISVLLNYPKLERLSIPIGIKGVEALREHPSLKQLTYQLTTAGWSKVPGVAEFWKAYDARKNQ